MPRPLPGRLRTRTVDVILETMDIQPATRTALHRVAPAAYGTVPIYLTDDTWAQLGPAARVDLLLLCRAEDAEDAAALLRRAVR